jgi:hypothetical protein
VPGGDQRGRHLRWDGELRVAALNGPSGPGERGFKMSDAQIGASLVTIIDNRSVVAA